MRFRPRAIKRVSSDYDRARNARKRRRQKTKRFYLTGVLEYQNISNQCDGVFDATPKSVGPKKKSSPSVRRPNKKKKKTKRTTIIINKNNRTRSQKTVLNKRTRRAAVRSRSDRNFATVVQRCRRVSDLYSTAECVHLRYSITRSEVSPLFRSGFNENLKPVALRPSARTEPESLADVPQKVPRRAVHAYTDTHAHRWQTRARDERRLRVRSSGGSRQKKREKSIKKGLHDYAFILFRISPRGISPLDDERRVRATVVEDKMGVNADYRIVRESRKT